MNETCVTLLTALSDKNELCLWQLRTLSATRSTRGTSQGEMARQLGPVTLAGFPVAMLHNDADHKQHARNAAVSCL